MLSGIHHKRTRSLEINTYHLLNVENKNLSAPQDTSISIPKSPVKLHASSSASDLTALFNNMDETPTKKPMVTSAVNPVSASYANERNGSNFVDESGLPSNDASFTNWFSAFWRKNSKMKILIVFIFSISALFLVSRPGGILFKKENTDSYEKVDNEQLNGKLPFFLKGNSIALSSAKPGPRHEYDLFVIADRDVFSYDTKEKVWKSLLIHGKLMRIADENDPSSYTYKVGWSSPTEIKGKMIEGERGIELSELKIWNNRLYTFDDRTGIVYEIVEGNKIVPKFILADGNAQNTQKGFKCEWATVKDGKMYVGSVGKEWTTPKGEIIGYNPMWVKVIDQNGRVESVDWIERYQFLRRKLGVPHPGYMIHEAVEWSSFYQKWIFLPRRVSAESYDDEQDIFRGSNHILIVNEDFTDMEVKRIGPITSTRGFSSFKFIPGHPNEIVALKSEEDGNKMKSYITIFSMEGKILLPETLVAEEKLEGIEII